MSRDSCFVLANLEGLGLIQFALDFAIFKAGTGFWGALNACKFDFDLLVNGIVTLLGADGVTLDDNPASVQLDIGNAAL
jgi:hypothetical protein